MSRSPRERLRNILVSCDAVKDYLRRDDVDESLVFDALRIRLVEIGEAAKDLPADITSSEPDVPWSLLSRMRDHLAHRYFDTTYAIVFETARLDVPALDGAMRRLLAVLA